MKIEYDAKAGEVIVRIACGEAEISAAPISESGPRRLRGDPAHQGRSLSRPHPCDRRNLLCAVRRRGKDQDRRLQCLYGEALQPAPAARKGARVSSLKDRACMSRCAFLYSTTRSLPQNPTD